MHGFSPCLLVPSPAGRYRVTHRTRSGALRWNVATPDRQRGPRPKTWAGRIRPRRRTLVRRSNSSFKRESVHSTAEHSKRLRYRKAFRSTWRRRAGHAPISANLFGSSVRLRPYSLAAWRRRARGHARDPRRRSSLQPERINAGPFVPKHAKLSGASASNQPKKQQLLPILPKNIGYCHSIRETAIRTRQAGLSNLSDIASMKNLNPARGWLHGLRIPLFTGNGAVGRRLGLPGSSNRRDDGQGVREDRGSPAHALQRKSPLSALRPLRDRADEMKGLRRVPKAISDPGRGFRSGRRRPFQGRGDRLRGGRCVAVRVNAGSLVPIRSGVAASYPFVACERQQAAPGSLRAPGSPRTPFESRSARLG